MKARTKARTFEELIKELDNQKKAVIKQFLEKHTIMQIEAVGFFNNETKARRVAEALEKLGYTVMSSRRLY